jgi:hypothetical protein
MSWQDQDRERQARIDARREADRQREINLRGNIAAFQRLHPALNDRSSKEFQDVSGHYWRLVESGMDDALGTELAALERWDAGRPKVKPLGRARPESFQGGDSGYDDEVAAAEPRLSPDQSAFIGKLQARGTIDAATAAGFARRAAARNGR